MDLETVFLALVAGLIAGFFVGIVVGSGIRNAITRDLQSQLATKNAEIDRLNDQLDGLDDPVHSYDADDTCDLDPDPDFARDHDRYTVPRMSHAEYVGWLNENPELPFRVMVKPCRDVI
jgi:hypothetical protein